MHVLALAVWLAALPTAAPAETWVPHTDGRVGGCYRSDNGWLHNCTPQPGTAEAEAEPAGAPISKEDARAELRAVKIELERLKQRQAEDDARREREQAERDAVANAAKSTEQREIDAAMAGYNAIEAAKDSVRLRELQARTEACRKPLAARGFKVVGPGACQAKDGTYVNCPDC